MKKQKSQKNSPIALNYFAVCPSSVTFLELHSNTYILYLQKSLQILARFPSIGEFTSKEKMLFDAPEKVYPFRIVSQKSMVYQWSIYKSVQIEGQKHEQFIQSEKVDLTNFWLNFMQKNEPIKEMEITFKKMKCKYSFLIAVGDMKQIQQSIFKYLNSRNKGNQGKKELQLFQQQVNKLSSFQQNSAMQIKIPNLKKEILQQVPQLLQSYTSVLKIDELSPPQTKQSFGKGLELKRTQSLEMPPRQDIHKQLIRQPQNQHKNYSQIKLKGVSIAESQTHPQLKLHLSTSEMEICNDIQQRIKQSGQIVIQPGNLLKGISLVEQSIHAEMMTQYKIKKAKRITSSQKLNQKGQIIVTPFYYHFKYYLIIILVILIFAGLVILNPQSQLKINLQSFSKQKQQKLKKKDHDRGKKKKS